MTTLTQRYFQLGARKIPAPFPNGSLIDNFRELQRQYDFLKFTTVLESDATVAEDGSLVFNVTMPPAKTNG